MTGAASELAAHAALIAESTPGVDVGPAANVVEALRRVMRDLPSIGRDQTASQSQGGYAYRGIEQITKHTQGLFARHGVVFTPRVLSYEVRDLTINNKPWTDVYELVEYTVYGPGGIEDRIIVGPILAIGRDNSDKGANKCLTQALKYALLQALCISDAKDDTDGQTHEADAPVAPFVWDAKAVQFKLRELCDGDREKAKQVWIDMDGGELTEFGPTTARDLLEEWEHLPADPEVEP